MHLWALSNSYSLDPAKKERRNADKKRKFEDTNIVHYTEEDGLKKARIENYRDDEIMLDSAKKMNLEATHKQIPILSTAGSRKFSCGNCGKSFSCHQALGGHKSTCNSSFLIREVGESSLQGLMRNKNKNSATSKGGPHECKICGKAFPNGWALGGHKRSHRTGQVEPSRRSTVSPPKEITKESLHPINSFTQSVPEAQDESLRLVSSFKSSVPEAQEDTVAEDKKIMMFDLNQSPPKDEDEFDELLLCLEPPIPF
ncbi:hypothetical protein C5167_005435 [Papaver somniferum]|uniref:C2H2-type domain-containing protein n=2 Tax=Papaver somniferum TaxID=3469 RepID=A0A4Y7JED6_PAPSO|nr:hypothetical protein C5167_005435 [Papaver somniferum]